jgi:alkylhydroperoxidase family enzyme
MSTETVTARIAPLASPYDPRTEEQLVRMMPPGVPPIALFRTFARNLTMTEAMTSWGSYELGRHLSLSQRQREIVITRTCARCHCEYEWGVHVAFFAERAGLNNDQLVSLTAGSPEDDCWVDETERLLISAVDSLHETSDIPDEVWTPLSRDLSEANLLDLLLLCGWYHAISFAARATRVPLESDAPRFSSVLLDH